MTQQELINRLLDVCKLTKGYLGKAYIEFRDGEVPPYPRDLDRVIQDAEDFLKEQTKTGPRGNSD